MSDVIELPVSDPRATVCGTCGRGWDDSVSTSWTPVPSGRCPFEYDHKDNWYQIEDYKDTEIERDYRGYYLAHVLVENDGPDYYWLVQADSLEGLHLLIDKVR